MLRALQQFGSVDLLLSLHDLPGAWQERIERVGRLVGVVAPQRAGEALPWSLMRPLAPGLVDRLAHNLGSHTRRLSRNDPALAARVGTLLAQERYDLIVVRYLETAARCGLLGDPRLVIDVDDLWTDRYGSRLRGEQMGPFARCIVRRHLRAFSEIEPGILRRAAWCWYVSETNLRNSPTARASLLPNVAHPDRLPQPPSSPGEGPPIALFVGTIGGAVVTSLNRLVFDVWPRVRERVPTARLRIVGNGLTDSLRARWASVAGVEPVGFADDLDAEYRACSLTVAPMLSGSGTNIKVLESFVMGRCCVATPVAHRGFEAHLMAGEAIAIADMPGPFADAVAELLVGRARRDAMAVAGQAAVAQWYSFEAFAAEVGRTLARLDASTADATVSTLPAPPHP